MLVKEFLELHNTRFRQHTGQKPIGEEQSSSLPASASERIRKVVLVLVETEETVKILQVHPAYVSRIGHVDIHP